MKTHGLKMLGLFLIMGLGITVMGQDRQEVPGDYFSLEGALELFKKAQSPEEFERLLNSPNSKVNNLDLNGDGEIDYIRVIDRNEGNVHAFILQAVLSNRESQDVAVIELEKLANGKAVLQIIGDEDVYGIETIIEPTSEVRTYAGTTTSRAVVNVWAWPSVQYVYSPYYEVWVSPWHWFFRPVWWISWSPIGYYDYYSYWSPYRSYYTPYHTHRVVYAQTIYRPYRTCSPVYYSRHTTQIVKYREHHNSNRGNHYGYGRGNRDNRGNHNGNNGNNGGNGNNGNHDNNGNNGNGNNGNNGNAGNNGNNGDRGNRGNNGNHYGQDKNRDSNTRTTNPNKSWTRGSERTQERSNEVVRNERSTGGSTNVNRNSTVKREERTVAGRSENRSQPNVSQRSTNAPSRNSVRTSNGSKSSGNVSRGSSGSNGNGKSSGGNGKSSGGNGKGRGK
jgi:hypothetical protein